MASTAKRTEDTLYRNNYIVELIKTTKEGISAKEIGEDCNLTPKYRSYLMTRLMSENPQIKKKGSYHSPIYYWDESNIDKTSREETIQIPQRSTHSPFLLNRMGGIQEGKLIDESLGYCPQNGEIWMCRESNGTMSYIYILANATVNVLCVKLFEEGGSATPSLVARPIKIDISKKHMIGDLEKLTYKPIKYLSHRIKFIDDNIFHNAMYDIIDILNIESYCGENRIANDGTASIKEKAVIPENYISKEKADLLSLKNQLTIWKEVANKLLDKSAT